MRARVQLILILACMAGSAFAARVAAADAETFAPKTYGVDRYQHIWKRSPFIVETVAAVQSPGLASKYGLVGIASLNALPVVFLWDKSESDPLKSRFMVSQSKADAVHNVELVSVSMEKDPRKSTATIKQGSEQALLQFDPSGIPPSGPAAAGANPVANAPSYVPTLPGGIPRPVMSIPPPPTSGNAPMRVITPNAPVPVAPTNSSGQVQPPPVRRIIRPKPIDVN